MYQTFKPLPDDKILDWSKQKQIEDDISKCISPFPKRPVLDSSIQKNFADDNFKFDKNGRKFSKQVENTVEKMEIAHYEPFLLFQQCFQKTCTTDT